MGRARRYDRALGIVTFTTSRPSRAAHNQLTHQNYYCEKRLRMVVPDLLRLADFWGRVGRSDYVLVLPETGSSGVELAVKRMVAADRFLDSFSLDRSGLEIELGATALDETISSAKQFLSAARRRVVWSNDDPRAPIVLVSPAAETDPSADGEAAPDARGEHDMNATPAAESPPQYDAEEDLADHAGPEIAAPAAKTAVARAPRTVALMQIA